ncbi:hypothetical protein KFE25_011160 [Diacronema lutheri]|uniref:Protein kinase domain-containing protein n=1 Tax=Diacronema lutheri TaxID=2081491 RepID=A0A8J6CD46_DIALT|nr:hypothetical protein KFE25_011160 [Diacronema lutheri]
MTRILPEGLPQDARMRRVERRADAAAERVVRGSGLRPSTVAEMLDFLLSARAQGRALQLRTQLPPLALALACFSVSVGVVVTLARSPAVETVAVVLFSAAVWALLFSPQPSRRAEVVACTALIACTAACGCALALPRLYFGIRRLVEPCEEVGACCGLAEIARQTRLLAGDAPCWFLEWHLEWCHVYRAACVLGLAVYASAALARFLLATHASTARVPRALLDTVWTTLGVTTCFLAAGELGSALAMPAAEVLPANWLAFALACPAKFGEIDAFISHSWRSDGAAKWALLQSYREAFKRGSGGREPTIWFDKACLLPDDLDTQLALLPVFVASCKSFVVLLMPCYLERLWCVVELFVWMHVGDTRATVLLCAGWPRATTDVDVPPSPDGNAQHTDATVRRLDAEQRAIARAAARLEAFRVEQAECDDWRTAERLLSVIDIGFGGLATFDTVARALLRERLDASRPITVNDMRGFLLSARAQGRALQLRTQLPPLALALACFSASIGIASTPAQSPAAETAAIVLFIAAVWALLFSPQPSRRAEVVACTVSIACAAACACAMTVRRLHLTIGLVIKPCGRVGACCGLGEVARQAQMLAGDAPCWFLAWHLEWRYAFRAACVLGLAVYASATLTRFLLATHASTARVPRALLDTVWTTLGVTTCFLAAGELGSALAMLAAGVLPANELAFALACVRSLAFAGMTIFTWPAKFGEIDAFISHSWRSDGAAKWALLQSYREAFKRGSGGREPIIWLDKACLSPDDLDTQLALLPVFVASCKSFIVLLMPCYLERLWCVVELFVWMHVGDTRATVLLCAGWPRATTDVDVPPSPDGNAQHTDATVRRLDAEQRAIARAAAGLEAFCVEQAECDGWRTAERLLSVIDIGFGGLATFDAVARAVLRERLDASLAPAPRRLSRSEGGERTVPTTSGVSCAPAAEADEPHALAGPASPASLGTRTMPLGAMTRNRSAPGTVGHELWQAHGHDSSKDGRSFVPTKDTATAVATGASVFGADGGVGGAVPPPLAKPFSTGLSMMTSAFSSRPSPGVSKLRQPSIDGRRLRSMTHELDHTGVAGSTGARTGDEPHSSIPLPREYVDDLGRTPDALEFFSRICHLAARGDLPTLQRKVAELPPGKLQQAGSLDNRTPLHFAAAAGHVEVCEWLLQQGVSVNPVDGFGLTPLAEAVRWSHRELARILVAHGGRLFINGELVTYHNFDAQVPLLNASMTDEDWEVKGTELRTEGMIGQGSFGLIYKATWRGTPVAIKQIQIQKGAAAPARPPPAPPARPSSSAVGPVGTSAPRNYGPTYAVSASQRDGAASGGLSGVLADVGAVIGGAFNALSANSPVGATARRPSSSAAGGRGGSTRNNGGELNSPTLEAIVAELREELYLMSHLHHPHILQFLGAVTKPGPHSPAIVMELAVMTLAHAFRDTPRLPFAAAMASSIHVARGMAYLHGHHPHAIIHRDLKPSNVLQTAAGLWKVCDFGLSRLLPRAGAVTDDAYIMTGETGSYVYMAPEVYKHESYNLKVDQYAYAMILYQAFQGERPFARLRPVDAARAASTGRRPSELGRLPQPIRLVVTACWNDEPNRRPPFLELVPLLEDYAASRGLTRDSNYSRFSGRGGCAAMLRTGACPLQ